MKRLLTLTFAVALLSFVGVAQAASLQIDTTDGGSSWIFAINLVGLTEADQVAALSVELLPGSSPFENYSPSGTDGFTPKPAGDTASFVNALLAAPVAFGGLGWGVIDGSPAVAPPSGPNGIGFAASTPGSFLTDDPAFLANVMLPKGTIGSTLVILVDGQGNAIPGGRLEAQLPIPEPGTMVLVSMGLIGMIAVRRRRAC